jgi:hypothetical protein
MSRLALPILGALACGGLGCHHDVAEQSLHVDWQPLFSDPHQHAADLHETGIFEEFEGQLHFTEVAPARALDVSWGLSSPDRSFRVFRIHAPRPGLLVQQGPTGPLRELQVSSFLPERPFEALVWMDAAILVFDQWRAPRQGIHYTIDVASEQLLQASSFSP